MHPWIQGFFLALGGWLVISPTQVLASSAFPTSVSNPVSDKASSVLQQVDDTLIADHIRTELVTSLREIQSQQRVLSIGGRSLSVSSQQVETILLAMSARGIEAEPAITALQQQLSFEIQDVEIEISLLEPSVENLTTAVSSANELILSMNSAQLAVLIESPTFMALLRTLGAANKSLASSFTETSSAESSEVNIPHLRLMW